MRWFSSHKILCSFSHFYLYPIESNILRSVKYTWVIYSLNYSCYNSVCLLRNVHVLSWSSEFFVTNLIWRMIWSTFSICWGISIERHSVGKGTLYFKNQLVPDGNIISYLLQIYHIYRGLPPGKSAHGNIPQIWHYTLVNAPYTLLHFWILCKV